MSKIKSYLSFVLVSIIGSALTFYLGNFIFADIGNNAYGWNGWNIFVTIPAVMLCFQFIALSMLIVRIYIDQECKNRTILLYLRIIIAFSVIGIIGVFLSAKYSYGTLFSKYPFPYYLIIFLVLNIVIIVGSILIYIKTVKNKEGGWEHKKITAGYVFFSIFLAGFTFYSFYKFGALLLSPLYVQTSTLYMTWPVYVWLAMPMLVLNLITLIDLGIITKIIDILLILLLLLFLNICLSATYFISSYYNTLFVSAISPAFGLDRLATNPYVAMFHAIITCIVLVAYLIKCFAQIFIDKYYDDLLEGSYFILAFIILISVLWFGGMNNIVGVVSDYVSYYSTPTEESSNLYYDYIYSLPCTYQETTEEGKIIRIMNLDEAFGYDEADNREDAQAIIDNDIICKQFDDFFHHNTDEFLEYFWSFSKFDKILINGKFYHCDGYTEVYQNMETYEITNANGKTIYHDGIIGFIVCQSDGYKEGGRFMAILSETK